MADTARTRSLDQREVEGLARVHDECKLHSAKAHDE
jgi:hypothetical protein